MRLLDLFCCAGGAAMGYARAGFEVVGVDIDPQPNYPFEFHQADALTFPLDQFDAVHASPPCQHYSDLAKRNGNADDWPDLVAAVRARLDAAGLPYVIENVEGAPLIDPVMLCGTQFPELRVIRHRLFETNWPLEAPAEHPRHPLVFTHDKRKAHYGKLDQDTSFVQVTGGGNCTVANKRAAMGIDWATGAEVNEAIPPAYTEHIGRQLAAYLRAPVDGLQEGGHMTEAEFQSQVVELASMLGWAHLHIRRTRGRGGAWVTSTNLSGWPDLLLWHPQRGVLAAELKSATGQLRPDQETVLASLEAAGIETHVWRPDDWPTIQGRLTGRVAA